MDQKQKDRLAEIRGKDQSTLNDKDTKDLKELVDLEEIETGQRVPKEA